MAGEGAFQTSAGVDGGGHVIVSSAVHDVGVSVAKRRCGCRHRGNHLVARAVRGAAVHVVTGHRGSRAGNPGQRDGVSLRNGGGEIDAGLVRAADGDALGGGSKCVAGIAWRYRVRAVGQSRESVITGRVRGGVGCCRTGQGDGSSAKGAARQCDRAGNAKSGLRRSREIDSGNIGAIDRCVLTGGAKGVGGVAGCNRVGAVC